ncbi:glycosyl transferase [Actinobacteria bacterium IMCC26207]|nr:glycosyl transferase [Actinobacteria bacterium IMCC26207]
MDLLRRFALVGLIATAVDVIALLVLREQVGLPIWIADSLAVALATGVSWVLHGLVSFPDDPARRWYNRPAQYVRASAVSLLADVFVLSLLYELLHPEWWGALLVIKLPALMVALILRLVMYREAMFVTVRQDQQAPNPRTAATGQVRLSVVVPAYGEADRIADSVQRIRSALSSVQSDGGLQIVVVDDGSSDATAAEAERAGADLVLKQEVNAGKGSAVRAGMLAATGRVVAFTDADLSYAPDQLLLLLDGVEQGWDVVVGSRQHVETQTVVRAGRIREVGGRIINVLTGLVLLGRYRDTQCGLKAMRADVGRLIFSHAKIDGFAFDVEVFALVERYRLTLHEVPVEVQNSERSTVNVARDAFRLIRDLFRIRRWGRLGQYEVDPAEFPEAGAQA